MNSIRPKVSVGIPVYNGERFLAQTVEALLAQTYTDFEIVISDNGSSDHTEAICRNFADRDSRVRYQRNHVNRGAAWNHNQVFHLASGEYFKWNSYDDICAPDFLRRCVEVLDADPGIVLCHPKARVIDAEGNFVRDYEKLLRTNSEKPEVRFRDMICIRHYCYQIYGLIRSSALRDSPLIGSFTASDLVLLGRLALIGRVYEIPDRLFFPREHKWQSGASVKQDFHKWAVWFDPALEDKIVCPHFRIIREHWRSVAEIQLSSRERFSCYLAIRGCFWGHARERLWEDIGQVLRYYLNRYLPWVRQAHRAWKSRRKRVYLGSSHESL